MKKFVVRNWDKYFKFLKEKLYSKLTEDQDLRKLDKLSKFFLTAPDELVKYVDWCNQIILISVYVTMLLRFWVCLIQNCNWLTLNPQPKIN